MDSDRRARKAVALLPSEYLRKAVEAYDASTAAIEPALDAQEPRVVVTTETARTQDDVLVLDHSA